MGALVSRNGKTYYDPRSKRAIAIDKAINAKERHGTFNAKYKNAPNRSDVEEYDHIRVKVDRKPKLTETGRQEPVVEEGERNDEYLPDKRQEKALIKYFHKLPPEKQYQDLRATERVVRTREQLKKWKKNPSKHGDVRGIDTRPPELIPKRLEEVQKVTGASVQGSGRFKGVRGLRSGEHGHYAGVGEHGHIKIRDKRFFAGHYSKRFSDQKREQSIAHEHGHAFDRNILSPTGYKDAGNVPATKETTRLSFLHRPFESKQLVERKDGSQKAVLKQYRHAQYKKKYPQGRGFERYRKDRKEVFADVFGAYVTKRRFTQKQAPEFAKSFEKQHKGLVGKLRASDKKTLRPYMSGDFK